LGNLGNGKQIAKIANQLTGLAILAMVKRIAKIANVRPRHPDRPRTKHALPGMDRYANQIGHRSVC
jgi:hypothetical protein